MTESINLSRSDLKMKVCSVKYRVQVQELSEMRLVLLFLVTLNSLYYYGKCAKILGVFPAPGYSQFILAEALMKDLANKGHQVTVICPYIPKNAIDNYKTIKTDDVLDHGWDFDLFSLYVANLFTNILTTYQLGNALTEGTLKDVKVQQLLHSDETFDVVIVEQFFDEALKGFAAHFNAPLVTFCSQGAREWARDYVGIPSFPAFSAITYTSYTNRMTYFQRFRNFLGAIFDYYYKHFVAHPIQKELMKKYFPKPMDFDRIIYNSSLMLLNSHVTTSESDFLPYNAVEIGGFHISEKPLSEELRKLLDGAEDGAILFSLGSNLRSADLSESLREDLFKVFRKLKQKIVWKFEEDIPNKPSNVWISKWLNQSDILAHPNVHLFITHGGLLSTTEAIFYGVPMIGIPIFADQRMNMARAMKNEVATVISFGDLSEETLATSIDELTTNIKYRENARRLSNLMRDRVVRPLDLASYWIEYVIRHGGRYFPTAASELTWFQIYLVDIFVLILFVIYLVFRLFSRKNVQRKIGKNKQKKQ